MIKGVDRIDNELKEILGKAILEVMEKAQLRQPYFESEKYLKPYTENLVQEIKEVFNKYERRKDETRGKEGTDNTSEEKRTGK